MSSAVALLHEFLSQHYSLKDVQVRILTGHERLVKETPAVDFMAKTFVSDANPHFGWYAAMAGDSLDWHTTAGSSWIFGRNAELRHYRSLLRDPESGLLGVWSSPKHIPSLGTSVEVWKRDAEMTPLLDWHEELRDDLRVSGLSNSIVAGKDGTVLYRGYHPIVRISPATMLRRMNRYDSRRNFESLFSAGKAWRLWDLSLLINAIDCVDVLITDEVADAVRAAVVYRWGEFPDDVVTDSSVLGSLFPSWHYEPTILPEHTGPCVFTFDRIAADVHPYDSLKPLALLFQAKGNTSSRKLLSPLRTDPITSLD